MSESRAPLTEHQKAIWLEASLFPQMALFNIGTYVHLNGIPDAQLLEEAIQQVIATNDALRMHLKKEGNHPIACFSEAVPFSLKTEAFETEDAAIEWMKSHFIEPLPMYSERLYDIRLIIAADTSFLYFKHHHIYIDGWGRALLVRKIADAYNGRSEKSISGFQRYLLTTPHDVSEATRTYWHTKFEDFEREPTFEPKSKELQPLGSERLVARWKSPSFYTEYPDKEVFYVQLAALIATVALAQGRSELTVGIPLLNRPDAETKNTIGYFVGLIPLRVYLEEDLSFQALVERTKTTLAETRSYRDVSIHEINKEIGMNAGNFGQSYDLVFSFEPHDHTCSFGTIRAIDAGTFSSDFEQNPLVLHVQQFLQKDTADFVFDFNKRYFDATSIGTLTERYFRILNTVITDPSVHLSALPLLTEKEHTFLDTVSAGMEVAPSFTNIPQRLLDQFEAFPKRKILRDGTTTLTYAQLAERSTAVAAALQKLGVKPGKCIAILLPRSIDAIIALTGIILTGASYVYLNPELGTARLLYMVEKAKARLIVSDTISTLGETILMSQLNKNMPLTPVPNARGLTEIYVKFTSGTTGKPKGISIPRRGTVNLINALEREIFSHYELPTLGLVSSLSFDASIQFIFSALCLGYPLVLVPEKARKDGRELARFLAKESITIADGVPAHLQGMILRNPEPPKGFNVKHFLIGGEALHKDVITQFFEWIGHDALITNAYGPTECSVDSTLFTFDALQLDTLDTIPVGKPLPNTFIRLFDTRGIEVPPGAKGEICIGGVGLASGYLKEPELTEEAFFDHPAFGRMYKTGDLGHWDPSGNLVYSGRRDNQVKIRGFRIELDEIEQCILGLKGVHQAAVLIRAKNHSKQLIAYISGKDMETEEAIRSVLREMLPEYMVPHVFYFLETLPTLHSGKIDRNTLSRLIPTSANFRSNRIPASTTEQHVSRIFCEILEIESVDASQSFFSLGGDSLSLIFLLAEIEETFATELEVSTFVRANSVREISAYLDKKEIRPPEHINFEQAVDRALPASFPAKLPPPSTENAVLLTGATGFVGAFLLEALLRTKKTVYCLIRAKSQRNAQERLEETLEKYNINLGANASRIHYVCGDLAKPGLGLSHDDRTQLEGTVGAIYHSGAGVHFLKDLAALEATNIAATSSLLELCSTGTLKSFHFISTVGVFRNHSRSIPEDSPIDAQIHTENSGYEASKWIAEGLVLEARAKGIPCSIYRLARTTGHSITGAARIEDFFHRFLIGCLDLGLFPEEMLTMDTDLSPVDITAQSVVALSESTTNETFHLINPHRCTFQQLINAFEGIMPPMQYVSADTFLLIAEEKCTSKEHPLYTILPVLKQKSWFSVHSKQFDTHKTLKHLASENIQWPTTEDLLRAYVPYLRERLLDLKTKGWKVR